MTADNNHDDILELYAFSAFHIKGRGPVYSVGVLGEHKSGAHLRNAWLNREVRILLPGGSTATGAIGGIELQARGGSFGPKDMAGVMLRSAKKELPLIGFCVNVLHVSPVMGGAAEVLLRVSPEAAEVFEGHGDRPMNLLLGTDDST